MKTKFEKIDNNIYLLKGYISSNIYYLDFKKKAIIDTGHSNECEKNYEIFKQNGFVLDNIDYIINTHSHGDHVGANKYLKSINPNIKIIGSKEMYKFQALRKDVGVLKGSEDDFDDYKIDIEVKERDQIDLGDKKLIVFETPGHTDDSICFYMEDKKYLFSGDLIYYRIITQLNYYKDLLESLEELVKSYNKINYIDIDVIFPGHGPVIMNVQDNIKICLKKLGRFRNVPEMMIINNLVPSAEYYIHKNNGCSIDNLKKYFVENMMKFKHHALVKNISLDDFDIIIDKVISLMKIMNLIKVESNRIYLANELNQYFEVSK